jgi:hypothetical protein
MRIVAIPLFFTVIFKDWGIGDFFVFDHPISWKILSDRSGQLFLVPLCAQIIEAFALWVRGCHT